jgi:transcriptional regulator with XRE-family HTH domain
MDWSEPHAARRVLARNVRRLREAKRLSQEKLAEMAELRQAHVSEIESGLTNLTLDNLQALAMALGVRPMELLNERPNNDALKGRGRKR